MDQLYEVHEYSYRASVGFFLFFSKQIITLLYANQYAPSVGLLQLYVVFNVLMFAMGHGLGTALLQTVGRESLALRIRLLAGGLNVLLNILLIPRWGAAGALVGTCLSGSLMWLVETIIIVRQYDLKYPVVFLAKLLTAALVAGGSARLLPSGGWVELAAGGTVYGLIFLGLFYLLKPLDKQDKAALSSIDSRIGRFVGLL